MVDNEPEPLAIHCFWKNSEGSFVTQFDPVLCGDVFGPGLDLNGAKKHEQEHTDGLTQEEGPKQGMDKPLDLGFIRIGVRRQ